MKVSPPGQFSDILAQLRGADVATESPSQAGGLSVHLICPGILCATAVKAEDRLGSNG